MTTPPGRTFYATGARVDRALTAGDVRLSMGGEPTFVSASDMEAPEWTTEALGPTKRRMAGRLIRRLVPLWSPGAALQYGLGKHYPGEQLPRWALHAHWRKDGEPIWVNPELLATRMMTKTRRPMPRMRRVSPRSSPSACRSTPSWSSRPMRTSTISCGSENRPAGQCRGRGLANLKRPAGARPPGPRLRPGPGCQPVGSVLPLRRVADGDGDGRHWQSRQMVLPRRADVPGAGRQPGWASACRWKACPGPIPRISPTRPSAIRSRHARPLPPHPQPRPAGPAARRRLAPNVQPWHGLWRSGAYGQGGPGPGRTVPQDAQWGDRDWDRDRPKPGQRRARTWSAPRWRSRPAAGMIHVFFPPLYEAEDWIDLAAAIEATAEEMGRKVFLEGYAAALRRTPAELLRHPRSRA